MSARTLERKAQERKTHEQHTCLSSRTIERRTFYGRVMLALLHNLKYVHKYQAKKLINVLPKLTIQFDALMHLTLFMSLIDMHGHNMAFERSLAEELHITFITRNIFLANFPMPDLSIQTWKRLFAPEKRPIFFRKEAIFSMPSKEVK